MAELDPRELFREESSELLQELETTLLGLEDEPDNRGLIDRAFRALHTIKGSASMFDLGPVVDYAHRLEAVFVVLRDRGAPATRRIIDLTLAAADHLALLLSGVGVQEEQHRHADRFVVELEKAVGGGTGAPSSAGVHTSGTSDTPADAAPESGAPTETVPEENRLEEQDEDPHGTPLQEEGASEVVGRERDFSVTYVPSSQTFLNGTNPLALLKELGDLGETRVSGNVSGIPPLEDLSPENCCYSWTVELRTMEPRSAITDVFMFLDEESVLEIEEITDEAAGVTDGPDDPDRTDDPGGPDDPDGMSEWQAGMREVEDASPAPDGDAATSRVPSIKVRTDRLDALISLVGELVTLQTQITNSSRRLEDRELQGQAEQLERLIREARELSTEMHMVPLEVLFVPFRRLVRDLASELGREVDLSLEGMDTELDRNVVEALRDPLLHVIRNAIDHGIELPEEREAKSKNRTGRIMLRARYSGAAVEISVTDDGRGIDSDKLLSRARSEGIVAPGVELSRAEILDLVFHSGFSTAAAVSAVSGRGVGMDVVRRNVERLSGSVKISSKLDQETTVILRMPLTLAIVDGLLFTIDGQYFLINIAYVAECIDGAALDRRGAAGLFDYRGSLVPLIGAAELFEMGCSSVNDPVVVIVSGSDRVGLRVSEIIGNHQSVVKSMGAMLKSVQGISGVVFLGDGTPAFLVDAEYLCRLGGDSDSENPSLDPRSRTS